MMGGIMAQGTRRTPNSSPADTEMPDEVASPNILCDTTSNNLIGPLESATPTGPTIADEVALSGTQCATTPQPPIEAATSVTPLVSLTSATPPDLSDEIASSSSQCQGSNTASQSPLHDIGLYVRNGEMRTNSQTPSD